MEFRRDSLERFHTDGKAPKHVPPELRKILRRKLIMIDRSVSLADFKDSTGKSLGEAERAVGRILFHPC